VGGDAAVTGAAALASHLTVTGTSNFNGPTNLGDATADTVTISGNVAAGSGINNNFDFSGSTGSFALSTGTKTLTSGATTVGILTVSGAAKFNAAATFGDATADTVTIAGNVAVSGTPTINLGTSALAVGNIAGAGTLDITGTSTFNGLVNLGDATADTVTIAGHVATSGNPNFALAGSGTFSSPTGTFTVNGAMTAGGTLTIAGASTHTGTANFNGATNLGDATTDTITIGGNVAIHATATPTINLGTRPLTAGATTLSSGDILGTLDVAGATDLGAAVVLGAASGNAITVKGTLSTSGNINVNLNAGTNTGTFTAPGTANSAAGNPLCHFDSGACVSSR